MTKKRRKRRKRRKRYNPDTNPDAKWLEENFPFTITEEEFYRQIGNGPVSCTRPGEKAIKPTKPGRK